MNLYEINFIYSYVFNAAVLFFLAVFVYLKDPRKATNVTFSVYSFSLSWWSFFSVFMLLAKTESEATYWDKVCLMGVVYIPITMLHFVLTYQDKVRELKKWIVSGYIFSTIFFISLWTPYFLVYTAPVHRIKFFSVPEPLYYLFVLYFAIATIFAILLLFKGWRETKRGVERLQNLYLFWATCGGYAGMSMNFNLVFHVPPYSLIPYFNYLGGFYGLVIAFVILKYRFMDIRA